MVNENAVLNAAGGSVEIAAEALMTLLRVLWFGSSPRKKWEQGCLRIDEESWLLDELGRQKPTHPDIAQDVFDTLHRALVLGSSRIEPGFCFTSEELRFHSMADRLFKPHMRRHDLRYLALRSIRRKHGIRLNSAVLNQLRTVTQMVSIILRETPDSRVTLSRIQQGLRPLATASMQNPAFAFCEIGLVTGSLELDPDFESLFVSPELTDPEYIVNHLFGLPTSMQGFDNLFGGSGMILPDTVSAPDLPLAKEGSGIDPDTLGARAVLVIGRFGSGKSLLSLQMAVEIARKGGIAWMMELEQTPEECRYSLESIGVSTTDASFQIVQGDPSAFETLTNRSPSVGCLMFLHPGGKRYLEFLDHIRGELRWMRRYPLRLLIVDPVNALQYDKPQDQDPREKIRSLFRAAREARVNVWFTSETLEGRSDPDRFEENIADTVIRLGVEPIHRVQRRYIEITKSRMQREQPGRSALVIESGSGIRVDASFSAIQRLPAVNLGRLEDQRTSFGVAGMDELLGPEGLLPGDIVAFAGPGKSKTLLGAHFLRAAGSGANMLKRSSIHVSDYSDERTDNFMDKLFSGDGSESRPRRLLTSCPLATGFIDPGRILQDIQQVLERRREEGFPADRILLTNLARWEQEMPLIAEDPAFGIGLLTLLRRYRVTAILICGDVSDYGGSRLRDIVFDGSDFLLRFNRVESRGIEHTLVRAVKTRLMRHPRTAFELLEDKSGIRVEPAPLLRVTASGDVRPVQVKLFLYAETRNHQLYNERIRGALRTSVSPLTDIASQSENYDPTIFAMTGVSAVDELQIIQLDEFQLPQDPASADFLHSFSASKWKDVLEDRLDDLVSRVRLPDRDEFIAVPFYQNISFLAHSLDALPPSWEDLARLCEQEEKRDPTEVFFSCAVYAAAVETYNCMFFEILQSLEAIEAGPPTALMDLFASAHAAEAALLFRRLCRRSHFRGFEASIKPRAKVYRHWYNTLNQDLADRDPENRPRMQICPLYGDITTSGEWYVAIPAYSASPEAGLQIVRNLTTPSREIERMQMGVALPTRKCLYSTETESVPDGVAATSRYIHFAHSDLGRLVRKGFRRSTFHDYQKFASTISSHLLWILEFPSAEDISATKAEISVTLKSLVSNIGLLSKSQDRRC